MAFITIAEYAARTGTTTQAVYKKIRPGGSLEEFTKVIDGVKMISEDAAQADPATDPGKVANQLQTGCKPVANQFATQQPDSREELISTLRDRIRAQAEELEAKNQQINNLTRILENSQKLQLLAAAPDPEPQRPEPAERQQSEAGQQSPDRQQSAEGDAAQADPGKKSFFQWLRDLFA